MRRWIDWILLTWVYSQPLIYPALHDLELNLGDCVWVNFKSNSVMAF
jgi:hypothetical protein